MIRYLFSVIWSFPGGNDPHTCTQKARKVIYIGRNNTGHRTHKIKRNHIKQNKQNREDNNLHGLEYNKRAKDTE